MSWNITAIESKRVRKRKVAKKDTKLKIEDRKGNMNRDSLYLSITSDQF